MKKTKRLSLIFALVLTFTACFGVFASAASIDDFTDVPSGAWYTKELNYATEKGLVNGTSATKFSPSDTMSRSQVITILWRAFSGETFTGTKFSDVPAGQWYTSAIYWGVENGVVNGTSSTTFAPGDNITRQDLATMLGRYITTEGIELLDAEDAVSSFKDEALISSYAKDHVEFMRTKGILKGNTSGNVNPLNPVTRAEGVALMARVVAAISGDNLDGWAVDDSDKEPAPPEEDDNDVTPPVDDTPDVTPPVEENTKTFPPPHDATDADASYDYEAPSVGIGNRSRPVSIYFPIVEAVDGVNYTEADGKPNPIDRMPRDCYLHWHRWSYLVGGKQMTATEHGYHVRICLDCGEVYKEGANAGTPYNHEFDTTQYVEPSKTENGSFVCYCKCCKFYEKVEFTSEQYIIQTMRFDYVASYNNEINYYNTYAFYCVDGLITQARMVENWSLGWSCDSVSSGEYITYENDAQFAAAVEADVNATINLLGENTNCYYFNFIVKEEGNKTAFKIVYAPISPNG